MHLKLLNEEAEKHLHHIELLGEKGGAIKATNKIMITTIFFLLAVLTSV